MLSVLGGVLIGFLDREIAQLEPAIREYVYKELDILVKYFVKKISQENKPEGDADGQLD